MSQFTVNDKPAIKMFATTLVNKPENNAILFDCEGDRVWLPKSTVKVIDRNTILIQEWIYKQKFPTK